MSRHECTPITEFPIGTAPVVSQLAEYVRPDRLAVQADRLGRLASIGGFSSVTLTGPDPDALRDVDEGYAREDKIKGSMLPAWYYDRALIAAGLSRKPHLVRPVRL